MRRTRNATTAREEAAEFNHKGCRVLAERGHSRAEIGAIMGLSPRSVRRFLSSPYPAHEVEKREAEERREYEEYQRTVRGHVRFTREGDFLTDAEVRGRHLRAQIVRFIRLGVSKVEIARRLEVSKRTVQRHAASWERARAA